MSTSWMLYVYGEESIHGYDIGVAEVINSIELTGEDARIFVSRFWLFLRMQDLLGSVPRHHSIPYTKNDSNLYVRLRVDEDSVIEVVVPMMDVKTVAYPCNTISYDGVQLRLMGKMVPTYGALLDEVNDNNNIIQWADGVKDTDEAKALVKLYVNEFIADYME